uniref:Neural cell adhesion molecule 2-like n=1 Tax=Pogona vitticeps TaxID=103695 RepID=A0ABM5EQX9_9SAUR
MVRGNPQKQPERTRFRRLVTSPKEPSSSTRLHKMGPGRVFILIFLAETARCSREDLEIIPSTGDVELGKKSYFLCKVRNGGEATLTWLDPNDNEIDADSEPYNEKAVDELSKGLEMTLYDPNLGGIFTCAGQFDQSGATARAQIRIRVIERPTFVTQMEPVKDVLEGTQVDFNCQAKGIPPPKVRWIFQNQALSNTGDGRISVEKGALVIENVQPSDAGVYSCEASIKERNEVAFTNVSLNVKFTPRIQLPMAEALATQIGNPTQYNFTILANLSPSVTVSWKGKVFEGDDIKVVEEDQGTYMVSIQFMPTSQEDISELLITAINELGNTTKKVTLKEDSPDKGLGTGSILAIILAILLLLVLLVVDVSCYYRRQRGFLMYCRNNILGKNSSRTGIESNGKMLSKSGKNTVVNVSGIEA